MKTFPRIFTLALGLSLSLGVQSCKTFLDVSPQGQQTTDNYYTTADECKAAVMGCYALADQDGWWKIDRTRMFGDAGSDDAWKGNSIAGDQREFGDFARFFWLPNNEWFDNRYTHIYQSIGNCNAALVGIDKAPIDATVKQQLLGEVKFIRAYNYFELVKGFGGVPLVLTPVSPSESLTIKRASAADCYAQIIKDFQDAAAVLPEKNARASTDKGRATKGAANAYLAKAYLFTEQWSLAQQAAETVINSGQYSLGDFNNVWSVNNPNGVESVFELNYNADQTFGLGTALTVVMRSRADGGWGFNTPSSNLEQAFGNDPRRQWTIIKQGDNVGPKTASFDYSNYDTKPSENESGRISRKMFLQLADRPANELDHSPLNRIELRYADLLLMHAEASNKLGQDAKALTSLNLVRARANRLSPGTVLPRTSAGAQLLSDIWLERRLELAMEGHRYYDLVRQKRLVEVMKAFNAAQLTSTDPYDKGKVKDQISATNNLFPIPTPQIQLSGGTVTQNPGY
ncbi:RagB/SusD family nutrient uptake outer membrane protein [Hymenobacter cheonanensis]|uniref:RagB/SusD family nutrient uptake outer membrane protein n=1 Tax=Hymenobacter sp. CA2-7 TaxID=3063993 RepID=UPI00271291BC|nr:RagB/SusD family nutrient uptake outer membrane protein [Hymenobacter sp. CA2-7]MDO7885814.1 RagB/SusD family nutrient uptake outer membrane protein [Hymenobacter sp. CA2-7]